MEINLIHKKMTDKECLANIREMHKLYPNLIISPEKYQKLKNQNAKTTVHIPKLQ